MNLEESFSDDLTKNLKPRDFKCPCGKTYLSYAALFTHIKQKHEGKVALYLLRLRAKSPNPLPSTINAVDLPSNPKPT